MYISHFNHAVLCAALVGMCVTVVGAGSREAVGPIRLIQGIPKPKANVDTARVARAARHVALVAADDATWAARSALRLEPKAALRGIPQTSAERAATSWIEEKFSDRSARLNRDDRIVHRAVGEPSTLMADIALLRLEQRAALRATLTLLNRVRFDANIATLVVKRV